MGHSVAGKVLYPHCFANVAPRHLDIFQKVGQAYADRQPRWTYKVQQSYSWYPTLGDSDDYLYINHGVLAFTIEHGTVGKNFINGKGRTGLFWIMNPANLEQWLENDCDAALAAIEAALEATGGAPFDPEDCAPKTRR